MQHYVDDYESVPVLILACFVRYRAARRTAATAPPIYPACQNLLLAARALGYGGVLTGLHHMADGDLRGLLGIPDNVEVMASITLGRPLGRHGPVRRRPLPELVFGEHVGPAARRGRSTPRACATPPPARRAPASAGLTGHPAASQYSLGVAPRTDARHTTHATRIGEG